MKEVLHMHKIILVLLWTAITITGSCVFACWARSDMPDYPQDRRYMYEGDGYWISSHREIDEAILDEMSQSITIWNEEQIEIGQRFLPELQPPESVPEEYYFESLMITKYLSGHWEYVYSYQSKKDSSKVTISQKREIE